MAAAELPIHYHTYICEILYEAGQCSAVGHVESALHASALSLVFLIGYLGLDRVGEGSTNTWIRNVILKEVGNRVDIARAYFKSSASFDYHEDVGGSAMPGVYFVRSMLGAANASETPSRFSKYYPPPLSTYWFVCRVQQNKLDFIPYVFALVCFVKFFILGFWALKLQVSFGIALASLAIDFLAILWVVQRVWRIGNLRGVLGRIVACWDKWHGKQNLKDLDLAESGVVKSESAKPPNGES